MGLALLVRQIALLVCDLAVLVRLPERHLLVFMPPVRIQDPSLGVTEGRPERRPVSQEIHVPHRHRGRIVITSG